MILGYRLIESYWNKGIASETAKAYLSYAFNDLNLTEVYAICDVENIGSKNLLQKCGLALTLIHSPRSETRAMPIGA